MNRSLTLSAIALAALTLAGCGNADTASEGEQPQANSETVTTDANGDQAQLSDISEGVDGQIGFKHGEDCTEVNNCSTFFTVESMDVLPECDGANFSQYQARPEGTRLVKATVLVETSPVEDPAFVPGEFPVWADWSALVDGVTQQLPKSDWCANTGTEQWPEAIHSGDSVRKVHYMDVPEGAEKIQLTDKRTQARWTFDAPS